MGQVGDDYIRRVLKERERIPPTVLTTEESAAMAYFDLYDQARNDLIKSAIKRKLRQDILSDAIPYDPVLKHAIQQVGKDVFQATKVGRKALSLTKLVTINAKDGIDPVKFWQQMSKCIKKQMLQSKRGSYVLEQRSQGDQSPYGWHIHWLVEFETVSSHATIAQQVYQCFQRYLGGSSFVDVRDLYNEEQWAQKLRYIGGEKNSDKMPKVERDRELRKKFRIPEIFSY